MQNNSVNKGIFHFLDHMLVMKIILDMLLHHESLFNHPVMSNNLEGLLPDLSFIIKQI